MRVLCDDCQRVYDDEFLWTICPHNPLHEAPDAVLCTIHDYFEPCPSCAIVALHADVDEPPTPRIEGTIIGSPTPLDKDEE